MHVRARILNYTIFGPAKFHYIPKNKFLKIENNFQKLKKNSRAIALCHTIKKHKIERLSNYYNHYILRETAF